MDPLEEVSSAYPVIALFKSDIAEDPTLYKYVCDMYRFDQQWCDTITQFLKGYTMFKLNKYADDMGVLRDQPSWSSSMDALSRLAFAEYVQGVKLSIKIIQKSVSHIDVTEENVSVATYGLLKKLDAGRRTPQYCFQDKLVRTYLAAVHVYNDCMVVLKSVKGHFGILSPIQKDAMDMLPTSGDLWRIVFGLLGKHEDLASLLLSEIVDNSVLLDTMRSFDITSLCMDCIFESGCRSLVKSIDDFCFNQSINFANVTLEPSHLHYTLASAGNTMRLADSLYAVHMPRFGITSCNIHFLADPLNHVSNNSIQVLELSGNRLGLQGIKSLRRFLVKASLLTHLDLSGCALCDTCMDILSQYFMCLPLICLRLAANEITDNGLQFLVEGFKKCKSIEYIDLSENLITDISVDHLVDIFSVLPLLRTIDLRSNYMSEAGIKRFSAAVQKLRKVSRILKQERVTSPDPGTSSLAEHVYRSSLIRRVNSNRKVITRKGGNRLGRSYSEPASYSVRIKTAGQSRAERVSSVSSADESEDEEGSYDVRKRELLMR